MSKSSLFEKGAIIKAFPTPDNSAKKAKKKKKKKKKSKSVILDPSHPSSLLRPSQIPYDKAGELLVDLIVARHHPRWSHRLFGTPLADEPNDPAWWRALRDYGGRQLLDLAKDMGKYGIWWDEGRSMDTVATILRGTEHELSALWNIERALWNRLRKIRKENEINPLRRATPEPVEYQKENHWDNDIKPSPTSGHICNALVAFSTDSEAERAAVLEALEKQMQEVRLCALVEQVLPTPDEPGDRSADGDYLINSLNLDVDYVCWSPVEPETCNISTCLVEEAQSECSAHTEDMDISATWSSYDAADEVQLSELVLTQAPLLSPNTSPDLSTHTLEASSSPSSPGPSSPTRTTISIITITTDTPIETINTIIETASPTIKPPSPLVEQPGSPVEPVNSFAESLAVPLGPTILPIEQHAIQARRIGHLFAGHHLLAQQAQQTWFRHYEAQVRRTLNQSIYYLDAEHGWITGLTNRRRLAHPIDLDQIKPPLRRKNVKSKGPNRQFDPSAYVVYSPELRRRTPFASWNGY